MLGACPLPLPLVLYGINSMTFRPKSSGATWSQPDSAGLSWSNLAVIESSVTLDLWSPRPLALTRRGASAGERSNTHIIGTSFDLLVQAVLVLIPEWGVPNQQDVQDDPWGEEQERRDEAGE